MKLKFIFNAATLAVVLVSLFCTQQAVAQRYLTERRPDVVLLAASVKKVNADQLNVIWSIKNIGEATAVEFGNLVALNVETSGKANTTGEVHNWVLRGSRLPLNISKTELKVGETLSGNTLIPYIEQELVSLRLTLDFNDDFYELKKENNTIVTQLVVK